MLLNKTEKCLVTHPLRAYLQERWVTKRFHKRHPLPQNAHVLEVGCGSGAGFEQILRVMGAAHVTATDADPDMLARARPLAERLGSKVRLQQARATDLPFATHQFDAVFDYGVLHHIPNWQLAIKEIHRVLKPGGVLYMEEYYAKLICNPLINRFIEHPQDNRFTPEQLKTQLEEVGFKVIYKRHFRSLVGLMIAVRPKEERPV